MLIGVFEKLYKNAKMYKTIEYNTFKNSAIYVYIQYIIVSAMQLVQLFIINIYINTVYIHMHIHIAAAAAATFLQWSCRPPAVQPPSGPVAQHPPPQAACVSSRFPLQSLTLV